MIYNQGKCSIIVDCNKNSSGNNEAHIVMTRVIAMMLFVLARRKTGKHRENGFFLYNRTYFHIQVRGHSKETLCIYHFFINLFI